MDILRRFTDREDMDEDSKRSILKLSNRLLTEYGGGRKDKKLNIIGDAGLDGLLGEAGDDVMEAFAIDPETGMPDPDKIRALKSKRRVRDYDDDAIQAFASALPAEMRGLFWWSRCRVERWNCRMVENGWNRCDDWCLFESRIYQSGSCFCWI